jgi:hypothetical protein
MQNGGQVPPFFYFSIACVLDATKKTKNRFVAPTTAAETFFARQF